MLSLPTGTIYLAPLFSCVLPLGLHFIPTSGAKLYLSIVLFMLLKIICRAYANHTFDGGSAKSTNWY